MSNSSIHRPESYCMPPKKCSWRFDNIDSAESVSPIPEIKHLVPADGENKMGRMSNEVQHNSFNGETALKTNDNQDRRLSPFEEGPIDFSVKNPKRNSNNIQPVFNDKIKSEGESDPKYSPHQDIHKRPHDTPPLTVPGVSNGKNSPPPMINWFSMQNAQNMHASQLCNESSPKIECSEIQNGCMSPTNVKATSSRESSPPTQTSILQCMLKSQDTGLSKIAPKLQDSGVSTPELNHSINPMLNMNTQMAAFLPHMSNYLSLPLSPYSFLPGMGYLRHPGTLTGDMLPSPSDTSTMEALAHSRSRRKRAEDRPFKSYTLEAIQEKLQSVSGSVNTHALSQQNSILCNTLSREGINDLVSRVSMSPPSENTTNAIDTLPSRVTNGGDNPPYAHGSGDSNDSLTNAHTETAEATSCTNGRKRKSTADVDKDEAYWDRRRKNNLAAKRSREARRRKEDAVAKVAVILDNQNEQLRIMNQHLEFKLKEVSSHVTRVTQEFESLTIQYNILQERLSQKRCGQCGARLPNVN